jgi:succinyl-CoA synthetase beta subunit
VLCILPVILLYSFSIHCQVDLKVPVVVRLEGTNVDQGKRILKVRIGDNSQALC